jgi:hypothetical protein
MLQLEWERLRRLEKQFDIYRYKILLHSWHLSTRFLCVSSNGCVLDKVLLATATCRLRIHPQEPATSVAYSCGSVRKGAEACSPI